MNIPSAISERSRKARRYAIANSLSLSQIREMITELKPAKQQEQLKTRFDTTYKRV